MSEFLEPFFGGALSGAILYSAWMAAKTICGTILERARKRHERAREQFEKEQAKKAREQKMISLLEENLSLLEENLAQLEK